MPMKKHISALVYMAIMFIMLFGVQQLERVAMCKEVGNAKDRYAIFIPQGPDVIGHLPQYTSITDTNNGWNIT